MVYSMLLEDCLVVSPRARVASQPGLFPVRDRTKAQLLAVFCSEAH